MNKQGHAKQEGKLEWIEPTFEILMDPNGGVLTSTTENNYYHPGAPTPS